MGPLIVLDECHKAKNLLSASGKPTLTGFAVMHLQKRCPGAAVLYSSATGISEPNNMAYMTRLGAFGYPSVLHLIHALKEAGLGASELFSCSLKASGIYLARCARCDRRAPLPRPLAEPRPCGPAPSRSPLCASHACMGLGLEQGFWPAHHTHATKAGRRAGSSPTRAPSFSSGRSS